MNNADQTVLIVEDEAPIRNLLVRLLVREGYCTAEAASADAALDMLRGNRFDLILLDLHMPGQVDGEEFLYLMRDGGDEVPIIVVSGWVDDDLTQHQPDCVHAVLKKPIQSDQLLQTVHQALSSDPLIEL